MTVDGRPVGGWLPHERLPVAATLSAYTAGVAFQGFEEHLWGAVTVGRRADLVWLERDPTLVDARTWPNLAVLGTWCGGRRTWDGALPSTRRRRA